MFAMLSRLRRLVFNSPKMAFQYIVFRLCDSGYHRNPSCVLNMYLSIRTSHYTSIKELGNDVLLQINVEIIMFGASQIDCHIILLTVMTFSHCILLLHNERIKQK